jgi:hypothetical protein
MPNFTDVMVDLETLGTAPGSILLSVGAVAFNEAQPEEEWATLDIKPIRVSSSRGYGLAVDEDTLSWWLSQEDAALVLLRDCLTSAAMDLHDAVKKLYTWYPVGARLWGNGADFDNVLLNCAFKACTIPTPWAYRDNRCYRTLRAEYKGVVTEPEFQGVRHDALADALHQTRYLQAIWAYKRRCQSAYDAGMRGDL